MFTGGGFLTTRIGERPVFSPEDFSEEQKEFGSAAAEFARNEIRLEKDRIEQFDKDVSLKLMRACGELGLLGADVPEPYGGLGLDKVTSALLAEKITLGLSESFTVTFSAHTGIGTLPIVYFGNEGQKKKYLPKLAEGEWLSAYALTEPGSGSDALSIRTSATLSEDEKYYILNGNKQFISNGGWADIIITFARIDGEKLTGFILDPTTEGVTRHEEKNKMGLHGSSTCNVILENVKVPVENVLGIIGKGADIAFNSLDIGRFKLGAAVLGGCKNVIELSLKYALERKQFGQPIAYFDAIKKKFAEMTVRTFALESIVYETAGSLDKSIAAVDQQSKTYYQDVANAIEKFAMECSICKVYGSEVHWHNADEALQVFGGYGFIEDYPMARVMRDTRIDRIYEGTNEINRQIILGYVVKKTLLEELPVREKIKYIPEVLTGKLPKFKNGPLAEEKQAVELAKYLTLYVFNEGLIRYGQDLLNHQQIGEILSDMVSDLFLLHTALSRISQSLKQSKYPRMLENTGKILAAEKVNTMICEARKTLCGILQGQPLKIALDDTRKLEQQMFLRTDVFHLKKELANFIYRHQKYPFEVL